MLGVIETERLVLRRATAGDVEAIACAAGTTATSLISASVADQASRWQEHGYGLWVLLPRGEERVIGWCGLKPGADATQPEIMFGLESASRHQGLATEAVRAVITFVLNLPRISSVWGATATSNVASAAVMKRVGMLLESERLLDGVHSFVYRINRNAIQLAEP